MDTQPLGEHYFPDAKLRAFFDEVESGNVYGTGSLENNALPPPIDQIGQIVRWAITEACELAAFDDCNLSPSSISALYTLVHEF
jgi:hypothetical protein